ncbi:hypothetical protein M413DRAFT_27686 [Hebeloma cylindrosporum]|uniref:Nucleoporin Nup54 alpha-helical domain-containing protein n=1 Tax=Hebeloma cylindrosporum TaxID=76867 RepID=A0A0C3CAS8_HEBCY|nr:hypothetical protein M413DRAFT_27686 [Hebeloma cylindrosporum h7]
MSIFGSSTTNTAGNSLFGSAANPTPNPLQAQPTQPALFGNTNTNTSNATGGGLFGSTNTNQNQNTGGGGTSGIGLFGGFGNTNTTNQQPAAGSSLFGNTSNTNAAGTSSIFGSSSAIANANTGNAPGSSLFGNTANAANTGNPSGNTSIFGSTQPNTNTTGNLFGNATQQTQNNPTSLFGGTGNTGASTGTTSGLFGSTTNNPTGGGLFGWNTNTQQQQQQPQQQQQQPTTGGGLFGNTQAAGTNLFGSKPAGSGLFGSTSTNTNPFGQQQQQQQPQQQPQQQQQQPQQSSLFSSSNLFGGNKGAFGGPAQPTGNLNTSALTTSNNLLASGSGAGGPSQSADPYAQYLKLTQSIEAIYNAWNPASKDCRFQHNFYNLVDPKQVNLYGRPPNATNDALWQKAVQENPDPSCLVPVIAVGWDDLRSRIEAQTTQSAGHIQKLDELRSRLSALQTQRSVSNTSRILRAMSVQTQQIQRVMRLVQHLHLLIPSIRSSALRPEEEALRGKLEEIEEEMRRARVKGRLNELWALIGALGAGVEKAGSSNGAGGGGEWAVVDEDGLAQIAQILAEQQAGLQHLTKILQQDLRDLNVVFGRSDANNVTLEEGSGGGGVGSVQEGGDNLWGSTRTLRASALK